LLGTGLLLKAQYFVSDFRLLSKVKAHLKYDYVSKDLDETKLEYGAIRGMLESLDDPYTRFIEPKNYKEMSVRMRGQFFGIGIHIGIRDKHLTVISPIVGTPADKAGLKSLDWISTIDGESTKGMSLTEAVNKIRGDKGTLVVLGIRRKGIDDVLDVAIKRGKIDLKAVDKVEVFDDGIGYIRLTTFESQNATAEVVSAIRKLKQQEISGLVLDLRYNGGGLLRNAINIASLFVASGDVVHTVNREGKRRTEHVSGLPIYAEDPLVVMLNEGSASASEIVAGSIKDNNRGLIMGRNSFGKASVQKVLTLDDGSAVLYTVAKYLTPKETDISKTGIIVDVESIIPTASIEAARKPGYVYSFEQDTQLQEALDLVRKKLADKE